jgi:hypothetical protein
LKQPPRATSEPPVNEFHPLIDQLYREKWSAPAR